MVGDQLLNKRFGWGFGFSPTGCTSVLALLTRSASCFGPAGIQNLVSAPGGLPLSPGCLHPPNPQVSCLFACLSEALRAEEGSVDLCQTLGFTQTGAPSLGGTDFCLQYVPCTPESLQLLFLLSVYPSHAILPLPPDLSAVLPTAKSWPLLG